MLDTFKIQLEAYLKGKKVNLSKERKDALAAKLDKRNPDITEADAHDTAIADMDELIDFAGIAKQDDKVRTLEARNRKPTEEPIDDESSDDDQSSPKKPVKKESETAKMLREMREELDGMKAEKQTQTIKQKLAANDKLKTIPADYYDEWQLPKTDDEIDAFADKVSAKYAAFTEANPTQTGNTKRYIPAAGSGGGNNTPKPSDVEIKELKEKFK